MFHNNNNNIQSLLLSSSSSSSNSLIATTKMPPSPSSSPTHRHRRSKFRPSSSKCLPSLFTIFMLVVVAAMAHPAECLITRSGNSRRSLDRMMLMHRQPPTREFPTQRFFYVPSSALASELLDLPQQLQLSAASSLPSSTPFRLRLFKRYFDSLAGQSLGKRSGGNDDAEMEKLLANANGATADDAAGIVLAAAATAENP